jgi:hypothetical protein
VRPPKPKRTRPLSIIGAQSVSFKFDKESIEPPLPKRLRRPQFPRNTVPRTQSVGNAQRATTTVGNAQRATTTKPTVIINPRVSTTTAAATVRVQNDDLGKYISEAAENFVQLGWHGMVKEARNSGDLRVEGNDNNHPATPLLQHVGKNGVPVQMKTKPWSQEQKDERLKHGSHNSCNEYLDFLREEMLEFVRKGYWVLLPYRLVRKMKHLRLSPMGIIPQRERRPRLIVDYTFWYVNGETVLLSPRESMQFGRALERTLHKIRHANPKYGPVYQSKTDLKDGFYRLWLSDSGMANLGVAFPVYEGEEPMVAFPLVLPMGWLESPPWFCAATETVADIANSIPANHDLPPHPMEDLADTKSPPIDLPSYDAVAKGPADAPPQDSVPGGLDYAPPPDYGLRPTPLPTVNLPSLTPAKAPVSIHDIFMDDYISLIQGNARRRKRHQRALLHSIDEVFRPPAPDDPPARTPVPSTSKMLKGDASWATRKIILGWLIDTALGIIALPYHRYVRLLQIFDELRDRKRVGVKQWHKVLGELRSMVLAIPGSKGLFSLLQTGFRYTEKNRIRITPAIRAQLLDFEHLARDLGSRPTKIAEIVPDIPASLGACDASGEGMGGVWFPATTHSNLRPTLWRARFPPEVQAQLVSDQNRHGTITNSDLELAGTIAHQDILVQLLDCRERTIGVLNDNIPAVSWQRKGSTTTTGAAAYLLRLNSLHQRHFRYLSQADYIPGPANAMADDCSRLWHLSDSQLLSYFNSTYPQTHSWQLCQLRPNMLSSLTSALLMKRPEPQSFLNEPKRKTVIGISGVLSAPNTKSIPTSLISKIPSRSYKFSLRGYAGEASPPATDLLSLAQWRTTFAPLARRSPAWGPRTPASVPMESSPVASKRY